MLGGHFSRFNRRHLDKISSLGVPPFVFRLLRILLIFLLEFVEYLSNLRCKARKI